jgi:hypothetical protein
VSVGDLQARAVLARLGSTQSNEKLECKKLERQNKHGFGDEGQRGASIASRASFAAAFLQHGQEESTVKDNSCSMILVAPCMSFRSNHHITKNTSKTDAVQVSIVKTTNAGPPNYSCKLLPSIFPLFSSPSNFFATACVTWRTARPYSLHRSDRSGI